LSLARRGLPGRPGASPSTNKKEKTMTDTKDHTDTIRELNDRFRQALGEGDRFMTAGIAALPFLEQAAIIRAVMEFDAFGPDNDPYGEHDFGAFDHRGRKIFWKIDYYDPSLERGSEDPADPVQTRRVLTIMLAEEY
jgi:hypothetical protein